MESYEATARDSPARDYEDNYNEYESGASVAPAVEMPDEYYDDYNYSEK